MMNEMQKMEKEVENSRIRHSIMESKLKILKKQNEIDRINESIIKYEQILSNKGLNDE